MFGIDIDDSPDAPVATPQVRRTIAIKWNWTTEYSKQEIADALGVHAKTVSRYLREGPNEEVQELVNDLESEVRTIAVMELKEQLQAAGHRSRTAEKPVKVWTGPDGNLRVQDKHDPETGQIVGKYPLPADMELGADEEARYYAREEVREILEQLIELTGAAEPEQHEVSLTDVLLSDDE